MKNVTQAFIWLPEEGGHDDAHIIVTIGALW